MCSVSWIQSPKAIGCMEQRCEDILTNTDPMDLYYVLDEMLEEGLKL